MGFGEIRFIAASTAGESASGPASTTTTPSSPTCTPMFAVPAITKKEGRTSRISRLPDGAAAVCDAALRCSRPPPCLRESAAHTPNTAANRARRHQSGNVVVINSESLFLRFLRNFLIRGLDEGQRSGCPPGAATRRCPCPTSGSAACGSSRSASGSAWSGSIRQRSLDLVDRLAFLYHRGDLVAPLGRRSHLPLKIGLGQQVSVPGNVGVGIE